MTYQKTLICSILAFRNYTKLAVLALMAYMGETKRNHQKTLPPVGIELRISAIPF